jgi:phosphatidylglycerol:prolipoprotein diacylglycerol transferase
MKPQLFGFTSYFLCWAIGAVVGISTSTVCGRRAGYAAWKAAVGATVFAAAIVLGSKLLFLAEHATLPADAPLSWRGADFEAVARNGFRIPGGILLISIVLPLVARLLRAEPLRFIDAVAPGAAIATVFSRFGCFLNGCCFGRITYSFLGVSFVPHTEAYDWQVAQGLLAPTAARSLPVYPLQLGFSALSLLLFLLALRWQRTKQFDGEVWLNFNLVFFVGTFLLELLRPYPLHLNFALCTAVVVVVAALRFIRTRGAHLSAAPAA